MESEDEEKEKQEPADVKEIPEMVENISQGKIAPKVENKRNFNVIKQNSLNEYRMPARKTSSKIQKKLSLFTNDGMVRIFSFSLYYLRDLKMLL